MSTPHCSLIVYLDSDTSLLESFRRDVTQFFLKFPLQYEVLLVAHKSTNAPELPKDWTLLRIDKSQGRAEGLKQACLQAKAPFVSLANLEMITPLGEIFKMLQNIMTSPEVDFCIGNRYAKKDSPFLLNATPRFRSEHFFNGILKERHSSPTEDFLSEALVLRKDSFEKIAGDMPSLKNFWYLGPAIIRTAQIKGLQILPIALFDSGYHPKGYSVWKERWNLLRQCSL